ncbi:hypothetical protein [Devosia sp. UYZn731]|uniref:glycoside hydrolase 5 family protein n=1 Tax=Devosia sp. UYZn731 TaxID=3156345 RepID=UPI0033924B7A
MPPIVSSIDDVFPSARLSLGCNYWASHAGTFMWRNWQPEIVDQDLEKLAKAGLTWLRVFPLWPDFQPITQLRGQGGVPVEIRLEEEPLPEDRIGQAGLSLVMLERFAEFCRIAERHGLKLVVGLITGWMSGRLFVPPALAALDPITDPISITWQVRFVREFVNTLRDQNAIAAWDLGNECNCMGVAPTPEAAYLWTAAIANAIRAADPSRIIVSGMHSLSVPRNGIGNPWLITHQGELTDLMTTHPYPYWIRHTNLDAVNSLRVTLHATAESRFYADISGKPCIAEEIGTMGPMVGGDLVSTGFVRANMFSLWANDCRAMAWWCGHDQTELSAAPYDWNGVELELGLLRNDGTAKPVLEEMSAFRKFVDELPFDTLPSPASEAICLLTHNQDDWAVAYSSYVLAKQAKLEIAFRHIEQTIPEAKVYLLPSLQGANGVPRRKWLELLERVKSGATLYVSLGDGIVSGFNEATGVVLHTRAKSAGGVSMALSDGTVMVLPGGDELHIEAQSAQILGTRGDNGSPLYWKNQYGLGTIFVVAAPLESQLTTTPRAFGDGSPDYWKIYAAVAENAGQSRPVRIVDPNIAVTCHDVGAGRWIICAINHSGQSRHISVELDAGMTVTTIWRGAAADKAAMVIGAHDAALFEVSGAPAH